MKTKILEIRDSGTFIPVMATAFSGEESPLLRAAGYARCEQYVIVVKLNGIEAQYSAFNWPNSSRTMREAHKYIEKNWKDIEDGDVIDVEFIIGESKTKKQP